MKKFIAFIGLCLTLPKAKKLLKDYGGSTDCCLDAANTGCADAQLKLGFLYKNGFGVEKNFKEAFKWFQKAAEQGNDLAQYYLGNMYVIGNGTPTNYLEAVKWYKKSASQGNLRAQYSLGKMYLDGMGVARNRVEALMWLTLSSGTGGTLEYQEGLTVDQVNDAQKRALDFVKRKNHEKHTT